MRVFLVAGLLVGCAAPRPEAAADPDGTPFLTLGEDLGAAFDDRVRTVDRPRARLTPDGPELPPPDHVAAEPLVVVDPGPWPRVGLDALGVRVLAYLDRSALERRIVAEVEGPVHLRLGQPVEVVDEEGDRVRVEADLGRWTAVPWLPRAAVDEVWALHPTPIDRPLPDGDAVSLRPGTELLDAPGGELVGWTDEAADPPVYAVDTGVTDGDSVLITFSDRGAFVEAWVLAEDLVRDPSAFGYGCSCGGSWFTFGRWGIAGPSAQVPAGTLLRAGPGGPVVAMALEDLLVPDDAVAGGAWIERDTPVGRVEVWADPADVVP